MPSCFQMMADQSDPGHDQHFGKPIIDADAAWKDLARPVSRWKLHFHTFRADAIAALEELFEMACHLGILWIVCQGMVHSKNKIICLVTTHNACKTNRKQRLPFFKTPTSRLGRGRQIKCTQREPELLHWRVRDDRQGWTVFSAVDGHQLLQNLPIANFSETDLPFKSD